MTKNFSSYQIELQKNFSNKKQKVIHIMNEQGYKNFNGFSEREIWGEFEDFDYEKWIKEQN